MSRAAKILDQEVGHASALGYHERHSIRRKSVPGEFVQKLKAKYGDDVFNGLRAEDMIEPSSWWLKELIENEG